MGEHNKEINITEAFSKDIENEKKFFEELGTDKPEKLNMELECMIEAYNVQLVSFATLRFDLEILSSLELAESNNQKIHDKKVETTTALRQKRVIIRIIRSQILDKIKSDKL